MAYQTSIPATTQGVIDALIAWLTSSAGFTLGNTWTFQTGNTWDGAGSGTSLNWTARALGRDGQYVLLAWLTSAPNRVAINSASVNPTTGRLTVQTGAAANNLVIELGTGPLKYFMYGDGDSGHCVVEWIGGAYQHINIGYLQKYGSFTGGVYVTGSANNRQNDSGGIYYNDFSSFIGMPFDSSGGGAGANSYPGHVRADYNSQTIHSFGSSVNPGGVAASLYFKGRDSTESGVWLLQRSPNAYNDRAILIPTEIMLASSDSNTPSQWVPAGRVNNAALINITNLNPGDSILTDWMVFPLSAKNSGGTVTSGYINSGNYGMAYKK